MVDWNGRLLGVLGKELKSRHTGSWVHYAIPAEQFADVAAEMMAGRTIQAAADDLATPENPLQLADLGIVLAPNILPRTPPFIDGVLPDSPAATSGLRPDDLIVYVAGQPTASCTVVADSLARRERNDSVRISVLRDGRLIEVVLEATDSGITP